MSRNTKPGGNSQDRPRTFACTAKGCGKAFVRSEHLSRHALNRKSALAMRTIMDDVEASQIDRVRCTLVINATSNLCDEIC